MDINLALVLSSECRTDAAWRVGKVVHAATSLMIATPLGIEGAYETDLMYAIEKRAKLVDPGCLVIAALTPFEASLGDGETLCRAPSPTVTYLLGYLQARLPKSHVFVILDKDVSDFWVDPGIQVLSFQDPEWRNVLGTCLAEIGVDVDFERIAELDASVTGEP